MWLYAACCLDPPRNPRSCAGRSSHADWYDEENFFRISGALPPDEGAMIQIAIDSAGRRLDALRSDHHLVDLAPCR